MTSQFTDTYRKLPTIKLLEIIDRSEDYQPIAVETAKFELLHRQDIEDATNELKIKNALSKEKRTGEHKLQEKSKRLRMSKVSELVGLTPSEKVFLIVLFVLLCEFGLIFIFFHNLFSGGPVIGVSPLIGQIVLLIFPGLPVFHLIFFIINRNSPHKQRKLVAKYTLIGNSVLWLLIFALLFASS